MVRSWISCAEAREIGRIEPASRAAANTRRETALIGSSPGDDLVSTPALRRGASGGQRSLPLGDEERISSLMTYHNMFLNIRTDGAIWLGCQVPGRHAWVVGYEGRQRLRRTKLPRRQPPGA